MSETTQQETVSPTEQVSNNITEQQNDVANTTTSTDGNGNENDLKTQSEKEALALMTSGTLSLYSPHPLDSLFALLNECQISQEYIYNLFTTSRTEFNQQTFDVIEQYTPYFTALPAYQKKILDCSIRLLNVKKRLANVEQKSESLAERIIEEAKSKRT